MNRSFLVLIASFAAAPVLAQHQGHAMPAAEAGVGHEGHDMSALEEIVSAPLEAPPPPEAFEGPPHAADTVFDPGVMAGAREDLRSENGDVRTFWIMADQLESRVRDSEDGYLWNVQGWYGGDLNKLWVKSEGEGGSGESPEEAEVQVLWSRAIRPWWDFQAGVRQDFRPDPGKAYLVLGLQGLAPYQFETGVAAFISEDGDLSARLEAEYDLWITQRLTLQPRIELELAAQDVPEAGVGSGLNSGELGLRLHYQFTREFAPYVGVEYERLFGKTADFAGNDTGGWSFLIGIRTWF